MTGNIENGSVGRSTISQPGIFHARPHVETIPERLKLCSTEDRSENVTARNGNCWNEFGVPCVVFDTKYGIHTRLCAFWC